MARPDISTTASLVEELVPSGRVGRRPQHSFQVEHLPYQIQPFFLAPVIPGETMENALLQARAISDPIRHPLIGWWLEHYLFYVKLTDLDDRDYFTNLMISASATLTGAAFYNATAKVEHYKSAVAGYDFVGACLKTVVEHYFRDEDESASDGMLAGLPAATAHVKETWMQSLIKDDVETVPGPIQGGDDEAPWDEYQEQWHRMRQMRMTEMTYEDWLKSFGIRGVEVEKPHRPELIRYSKSWSYPSNAVDPASGIPSSAESWSIAERADKARFFKEPGFLFGVTVARPKVYFGKQNNFASMLMDNAFSWMPAVLRDSPETSLRKLANTAGPLAGNVTPADYWVDVRDLLLYGDQFLNFNVATAGKGIVALPGADLTKSAIRYPSIIDVESLFTATAASGVKLGRTVRQDGVIAFNIKGHQVDFT